jgi:hypothetical protein
MILVRSDRKTSTVRYTNTASRGKGFRHTINRTVHLLLNYLFWVYSMLVILPMCLIVRRLRQDYVGGPLPPYRLSFSNP